MPFTPAEKRAYGIELVEFIYFGIRAGARNSLEHYQRTGDINHLIRALDMPNRARARFNGLINAYNAANAAAPQGQAAIMEAMDLNDVPISADQINADISAMELDMLNIFNALSNNDITEDEAATMAEAYYGPKPNGSAVPIPPGYTDISGA